MSLLAIESNNEECGKFEICKNPVFENTGACALHCLDEKIENTNSYLLEFSNLFMGYLFEKIKNINSIKSSNDYQKLIKNTALSSIRLESLHFGSFKDNNDLKSVINDSDLLIEDIFFPGKITAYIIKEFQKVYFKNCIFRENLAFDKSCIFYSSCTFYEKIEIKADTEYLFTKDKKDISYSPVISSPNEDEYKYKECVFESDVSIIGQKKINYIYYRLFRNCNFKKNINIDNVKVRSDFITISNIFEYIKIIDGKYGYKDLICKYKSIYYFNDISIKNCNFDSSFKINGIDIDYIEKNKENMDNYNKNLSSEIKGIFSINSLIIEETKFDEKFELKNCIVKNINFEDSNIKGIFDVYKSSFVKARFYKSIFEEFAAFEYVVFGNNNMDDRTDFIYVTFKDFSNFRDTHFKSGLSFSRANMKQEPNFLNTDINLEGTDRETLRIVKNSFEKNNNKIEANRFFVYEMNAYRKEIRFTPSMKFLFHKVKLLKKNDILNIFNKLIVFIKSVGVIFRECRRPKFIYLYKIPKYIIFFIKKIFDFLPIFFRNIIVNVNYYISGFGASYIRPLTLLLIFVALYTYMYEQYKEHWRVREYALPYNLDFITEQLNTAARNFLPFARFISEKSGFEFASLIFYVLFGVLTWQTVVAVKRHTQN